MLKARYSRSNKPYKARKAGIYKAKEITPSPQCSYVSARFALPIGYVLALQERYPNRSINMALKACVLENILPKDVKEI